MKEKTVRELRDDLDALEVRIEDFIEQLLVAFNKETGFEIGTIKVEPFRTEDSYALENDNKIAVFVECHIKDLML